jgi:uncharacterized protein YcbK (DUF882 family)
MQFINYKEKHIKQQGNPDIETIYNNLSQVIEKYKLLCELSNRLPYGGGARNNQGTKPLKILSGYRDYIPDGGVTNSPHFFCIALDIYFPFYQAPFKEIGIDICKNALMVGFKRIGLYPYKDSIHVDMADDYWCHQYNGVGFWVQDKDLKYHPFNTLLEAWKSI